jgi:hypothetical protein
LVVIASLATIKPSLAAIKSLKVVEVEEPFIMLASSLQADPMLFVGFTFILATHMEFTELVVLEEHFSNSEGSVLSLPGSAWPSSF